MVDNIKKLVLKSEKNNTKWDRQQLSKTYFKLRQSFKVRQALQSTSSITKCDRLLLQSASGFKNVTGCYYKVRQVLQSVAVITKWHITPSDNNYLLTE